MFQNVTEAKKFIGKSLQPARPVHQLSSKQASPIALNIRTELPSSTEVCLQSKVNWSSEMTEVKILTQTMMLCQPKQHESGEKKGSPLLLKQYASLSSRTRDKKGSNTAEISF
ncbi:uncharacterized protein C8orf88 homolog isoform X2 [Zonotrichia leucophrys gambelii]|uniref:uncharacterized protein C8orf88 homolog isoform X2 n=1 Tax=Zonotrichia leucophrys gambelii TaxID=257770 RepID=UPI00314004D1